MNPAAVACAPLFSLIAWFLSCRLIDKKQDDSGVIDLLQAVQVFSPLWQISNAFGPGTGLGFPPAARTDVQRFQETDAAEISNDQIVATTGVRFPPPADRQIYVCGCFSEALRCELRGLRGTELLPNIPRSPKNTH